MSQSRRTVLRRSAGIIGAGVAAAVAGCADTIGDESHGIESGYVAFFALEDWTNHVAGDHATFENPVAVGQMGHGWEPPGGFTADVAAADAFVYLNTPEFKWAQDLAEGLKTDYDGITVIDGMEGINDDDLLDWDHGHDDEHDDGHDDEHDDEHDDGHDDEHDDEHDDGHDDEHDDEHDDGHDHGSYDPHVWVDPVLAQRVVDTIADGLAAADPENEDAYYDNAAAYKADLDRVDTAFEELFADAARTTAVLAGHDSFQYLEVRYGFELRSPVGVSPEEAPSQNAIADTIEFVNDNDIDVILYDRFDDPTLAETIVENSNATETMALSPAEGTTEEWNEMGYGYVDQMLEVNVPALRRAFGAQ